MSKSEQSSATAGTASSLERGLEQGLEKRLEQHQQMLAEQDRANQIKTQDLIRRERQLEQDKQALQAEFRVLKRAQSRNNKASQRRSQLILPILLISAIAAGVFAFDNLAKQERYAAQVNQASDNIDKLTELLHGKVQDLSGGESYQQLQIKLNEAQQQINNLEQALRLQEAAFAQQAQQLSAREQALASLSGNSLENLDILAPISASNNDTSEPTNNDSPALDQRAEENTEKNTEENAEESAEKSAEANVEERSIDTDEAELEQQGPSADEDRNKATKKDSIENSASTTLAKSETEAQSASVEEQPNE